MSPAGTFERVYIALKQQLMAGSFRPGDRLEPALLGQELSSSITPVRDALHRLVGERLVAAPRHDGFQVPLLTETALRDLYSWNDQLLALATRTPKRRDAHALFRSPSAADPKGPPADVEAATGDLFLRIAHLSASAEHVAAVASANDRLHAVRVAEGWLLEHREIEVGRIQSHLDSRDLANLRSELAAYHRRRKKLADRIILALEQGGPFIP